MFNGIIFNQGKVKKILKRKNGIDLFIYSKIKIAKKDIGMSISCDGVCLTLVKINNNLLEFYLSNETIKRSKFRKIQLDDDINLEKPLKHGQPISGHIIQGHVDCVAKIIAIKKVDKSFLFSFHVNHKVRKNLLEKASISINGVSLTISNKTKKGFNVWVIPHTFKLTNFDKLKKNDLVNIEIDILSKYVKNYFNEK